MSFGNTIADAPRGGVRPLFVGGYSTELTAEELVAALFALHNGEVQTDMGVQTFMPVKLESPFGEHRVVIVQLDPARDLYDLLPDQSALLHCITPEGFQVDFLSPPDAQRNEGFLSAVAFVDPEAVK